MDNLQRAWRWIRSHSEAAYKSYCRPLYQQYAVAEDALLDDLGDRLRRGIYEPDPACKVFHPKASGILRPISVLAVEDQIVYQAAVNLVAEKLLPRVVHRYNSQIFGHLYAGKSSPWFYRKWSDGYKAFNDAAREAVGNGLTHTASFDLTACYDSLDHSVLRHFLKKLGLDEDFCGKLTDWLERWTATDRGIFHRHGIPQGPVSSGLLSEVVLTHFDDLKLKRIDFRYLRYVDDIRLFARNERDLRRLLVELDLQSKDIGLFPQSGKVHIHHVTNIEDELKTISNPPEASIVREFVDQKKLLGRIVTLTPRYWIVNTTRFKYLLAHAAPSAKLTARLWRVLEHHPEVYRSVCNYLRRYSRLPRVPAQRILEQVRENTLYAAVRTEFINAADGRLPASQDRAMAKLLRRSWVPRDRHADLQVAIARFLIRTGSLTPNQVRHACKVAPSWWTRSMLILLAEPATLGGSPIESILMLGVKDRARDVALAAAWKGYQLNHVPPGRRKTWNRAGELLFREVGLIKRSSAAYCGITQAFGKLGPRIPALNWRRLFGSRYQQAERQAVETVAASGVNITGYVNLLDVFNDWLLDAVYRTDPTIGTYTLGHIGSVLGTPTSRFATRYPMTYAFAAAVHEQRYQSMASHPLIKHSGKPTKRISYRFLGKSRRLLTSAAHELKAAGLA
ncbi:MAG: reverse transcriptase domain-containing protein [Gemmatimonadota bacterium]